MYKKSWVVREDSKAMGRESKDSKTPESQSTPTDGERRGLWLYSESWKWKPQSQDDYMA